MLMDKDGKKPGREPLKLLQVLWLYARCSPAPLGNKKNVAYMIKMACGRAGTNNSMLVGRS